MTRRRTQRLEVLALTAFIAGSVAAAPAARQPSAPLQVAQAIYGSPVGEYDGPIGGPMAYGQAVGSPALDSPALYGEPVGSGPIGGPMLYGEPVGSQPLNSPALYGGPVGMGGDNAPIGGAPLY